MVLQIKIRASKLGGTLGILAMLIAITIPAHATFPGKNGRIAFIAGPDIYTMNPDGSDVKQLTNLGPDNSASWESWSPDGKQIVFNEYRAAPDSLGQLWLMNADGSNQHLLLADSDFDDQRPSFTSDGSAVVFTRRRLDIEAYAIYQIGLAGGSPTAITSFELGIQDNSPKYSASGSLIFTGLGRRGIICAIYLKSRDGEGARQLTPAPLTFRRPDWSPDGNQIAASSHFGTPQNEEIWIFDRDGDRLRQLTNNGNDYFNGPHDINPSWSPQGDAIVFERDAPDFSSSAIFIMNRDGTGCTRLANLRASSRTNLLKQREIRQPVNAHRNRQLVEIEQGGANPQWGVAPN